MFTPGVSGNPGGRPKGYNEMQAAARKHTAKAIAVLAKFLDDPKLGPYAANSLLDRGWGKAPQAVALSGDGEGGPVVVKIVRYSEDGGGGFG